MGGNNTTGELHLRSERELYKYINHQAGTTKARTRITLIQMYIIFRILRGVPDYSRESYYREKQKLIGVHCYYFTEGCL